VVQSPGDIFRLNWPGLGLSMSWVWTIFFVLLILFEWVITLKNNYRGFLWTSALTLVISQWIGIPTNPDNFIVLLFPLILILAKIEEHWGKKVRWLLLALLVFVFIMNWLPLWSKINQELLGYSNNFIFFPLPLFLLLGLYWVRWWAIQPKPILLANLSSEEEV
jgi:F0F1-type ATP synthase membrane subunit a